jgi:hypothetical protein
MEQPSVLAALIKSWLQNAIKDVSAASARSL